jgi:hypothetical protein
VGAPRGIDVVVQPADTYDGKDIRARFVWSDITADSARWEQAFSVDGERTWITNWIVDFTRSAR